MFHQQFVLLLKSFIVFLLDHLQIIWCILFHLAHWGLVQNMRKNKQRKMKYQNNILTLAIICAIFFALFSCAPIKRHQRLVEKFPFVHTVDTVIIVDTFRIEIPRTQIDTVFSTSLLHDTITIIKDRLKIQMYTVHDSLYITGECDTITIEKIIERKIPVKYYEAKTPFQKYLKWILIGLFILAVLYFISKFRKNEKN